VFAGTLFAVAADIFATAVAAIVVVFSTKKVHVTILASHMCARYRGIRLGRRPHLRT